MGSDAEGKSPPALRLQPPAALQSSGSPAVSLPKQAGCSPRTTSHSPAGPPRHTTPQSPASCLCPSSFSSPPDIVPASDVPDVAANGTSHSMTCEKQFIPHDEASLYCSETCRMYDHSPTGFDGHSGAGSYLSSGHPIYATEYNEPRDIIPRASPSRPSSHYYSSSAGLDESTSPHHSSAMSALRSLTVHPPSPPSPTGPQSSLWPFSKSAATSPAGSYNKGPGSAFFPSTYDGYSGYYNYTNGMDRPLPTRNPSGYSRPKSIELVTPLIGR
ncbi:hypothetical protein B0T11DRAFT_2803 [Plectosphaerella cucumerina]|uniref:Uncharacterized protein n=1 Tax=Plectosphaerella cucumerina TaxID=40658 RepID=A0A8K0TNY8_9PEZI|nr:hypothetical protein B0T11DRAFT_2803 [Plectosphaerella cucumerina]